MKPFKTGLRAGRHFDPGAQMDSGPADARDPLHPASADQIRGATSAPDPATPAQVIVVPHVRAADSPPDEPAPPQDDVKIVTAPAADLSAEDAAQILLDHQPELRPALSPIAGSPRRPPTDDPIDFTPAVALVMEALERQVPPNLVEHVGAAVFDRLTAWLQEQVAEQRAAMVRAVAEMRDGARRAQSGAEVPQIRFVQKRRVLQHLPRPLPSGDVALYHNYDPQVPTSSEITIPATGGLLVDFGYRIELPPGWIADVTCEGISGQRVHVGTLAGSTHPDGTLKLYLRTNKPSPQLVPAGAEVARLHLRRSVPAEVRWTDLHEHTSAVDEAGNRSGTEPPTPGLGVGTSIG